MNEDKYIVIDENGNTIAAGMAIETALLLIYAYFEKYFNDDDILLTIRKMPRAVCTDEWKDKLNDLREAAKR